LLYTPPPLYSQRITPARLRQRAVNVPRWLAEQGLERCAAAFAENAITGETLRRLPPKI
jgi:hypothetical protein